MILTKILNPCCIKVPLQGRDKESAIKELVELLDNENLLLDKEMAYEAILLREKSRSTGIGSGIAIPHGKCKAVHELVMAVGVSREGIEFNSVDGQPVKIILLLVSPTDQTGPHIQALANISRLMLDEEFKLSIEQAESAQKTYERFLSCAEAETE